MIEADTLTNTPPTSGTLLLVDDNPVNLDLVVDTLELEGYEVLTALDGDEALQRAERAMPDLILLDVMMPGIDGFEVCRRLKANPATAEIPVIFITSLTAIEDKVKGFDAGGVDYLTKPLHIDEVRVRVNAHLQLRNLHRQLEEKNTTLKQEITERRLAEAALRRSHERLEEAQRIGRVGHWEIDLTRGRLECSDEIFRIFEIDRKRFDGNYETLLATAHPDDRERVERAYRDALEQRTSYAIEHRLLLPDGRVKHVATRCESWFGDDGRPLRSLGTVHDITPLKEAEERLRQLSTHREELREAERKRVAWQMHEELGQYLSVIRLGLGTLRGNFTRHAPGLEKEARSLAALLDRTIRTVREVGAELRPPVLDHGLDHALEWLAYDFNRRTGLPCDWRQAGEPSPLDEDRTLALFRVAEEALENIDRHAGAGRADLSLEWRDDHCLLTVRDDGRGFDPANTDRKPLGLMAIEARLAVFNGTLSVASADHGGTTVTARLPLTRQGAQG